MYALAVTCQLCRFNDLLGVLDCQPYEKVFQNTSNDYGSGERGGNGQMTA